MGRTYSEIFKEALGKMFATQAFFQVLLVVALVGSAFFMQQVIYRYGSIKAGSVLTKGLPYASVFSDSVQLYEPKVDGFATYRSKLQKRVIKSPDGVEALLYVVLNETPHCRLTRINEQLTSIIFKAHNHITIAREFMIQSFLCISISSIYFIMAAGSLAYITRTGIQNANTYMTTLLVVSAAVASFFFGLTKVFKQDENAQKNIQLYIENINLEQYIRNRLANDTRYVDYVEKKCATGDTTFVGLVNYIDKRMERINVISLGFDVQSVGSLKSINIDQSSAPPAGGAR